MGILHRAQTNAAGKLDFHFWLKNSFGTFKGYILTCFATPRFFPPYFQPTLLYDNQAFLIQIIFNILLHADKETHIYRIIISLFQNNPSVPCVSCPSGHFMGSEDCEECPDDTVVASHSYQPSTVEDSCIQCGPGLKSQDHETCYTDCVFNISNNVYNLTALRK